MEPTQEIRERGPEKRWWSKKMLWLLLVLVLVCGGAGWYLLAGGQQRVGLVTAQVTRGDLVEAINATGTVEPEEVVDVGSQIAGQILAFGRDANDKPIDYGSVVHQGTVLARIDDSLYTADKARAEAQVQASRAGLRRAQADMGQIKAKLNQASRDWRRARKLGPSEALAQAAYDAYQSAFETAQANLAVGEAAILQARAEVAQTEAQLVRAKRSLGYCTITSPVDGVIIDRRVNIGQTVVASLNAPSLFLIAKNLKRMQVWVAVNEADIGKIRVGQPVNFTVDAFPGMTFEGKVGKVRLNASMTQNVVTYTVEIITDNSNGRLLPYLSANVQFEVRRFKEVLLVPSTALRWRPPATLPVAGQAAIAPTPAKAKEAGQGRAGLAQATAPGGATPGSVVWVPAGHGVRPIRVTILSSDIANTAVRSPELTTDMQGWWWAFPEPREGAAGAAIPSRPSSRAAPAAGRSSKGTDPGSAWNESTWNSSN